MNVEWRPPRFTRDGSTILFGDRQFAEAETPDVAELIIRTMERDRLVTRDVIDALMGRDGYTE